jgi:hypothetical protein
VWEKATISTIEIIEFAPAESPDAFESTRPCLEKIRS